MFTKSLRFFDFRLGLLLILALAGGLRYAGYDFSLPYINHPDEPNYYLEVLMWRGYYPLGGGVPGYPPGILVLNYLVQEILGDDGLRLPETIRLLRLASITVNLLTLVIIAYLGRRLAGPLAGLIAAFCWAVAPVIVKHGVFATADPYTYLFCAMAVWLAVIAVQDPTRKTYAVWSVVAGLLAMLFKYPVVPIIGVGIVAMLWRLWVDRTGWRWLFVQLCLIAAVAVFLLFIYDARQMNIREANWLRSSGVENVLNPSRLWNNVYYTFAILMEPWALIIAALGLATVAIRRRLDAKAMSWIVCLVALIAVPWATAAFSLVHLDYRIKDVMTVATVAAALLGASIIELGRLSGRFRSVVVVGGLSVLGLGVWWPQLHEDFDHIRLAQQVDRRIEMREWADINLPAATVVVSHSNHKVFNPQWSGLVNNRQWFDWVIFEDPMTDFTIDEWRDVNKVTYLALEERVYNTYMTTEAGRAFLDELFLLREFTQPDLRGIETLFYRFWGPENALDVTFGEGVNLVGYDVQLDTPETLTLTLYWQADQPLPIDYSLFIHVLAQGQAQAEPVAQFDGPPARIERPVYTWTDPTETLISADIVLQLPDDLPAGDYDLVMGLYNWDTLERLPVAAEAELGTSFTLMTVTVAD